ncbi:MAG: DUF1573 domain-containing protein [Pirellulales bacterium]|nr:DUF1573 domain-containing protein [Pirellulales bacterium]
MKHGSRMRIQWAVWLLLSSAGTIGFGQQWAQKMLDHTTHDFGTVARGAKAEHRFVVENIYEEDMHIASISSTCGCTTPRVDKRTLKTWEKAEIVAELDTRSFYGQKDATLNVVFAGQFSAEVQLHIHAYIRRDVVVQPGEVRFASVAQGTSSLQKVTVDYAGRSDWQIVKVESANPYLEPKVVETHRGVGRVTYELAVTLKDTAPVGYLREHLVLVTNDPDPRAARVPVTVEGDVVPTITVQPSPLTGAAEVGKTATMRLFVQARKPFRIEGMYPKDQRFRYDVKAAGESSYLIQVSFTAGTTAEEVDETIRIETDLPAGKVLEVPVHVRVTAPRSESS